MSDAGWTVLDTKVEHANPYFQVWNQQVRLPDGQLIHYFSARHDRSAVGALAIENNRVLLVRQYRLLIDREVWAIPAGGVEIGEAPAGAAERELREETGYAARSIRPFIAYHPTFGSSTQLFEIFLAEGLDQVSPDIDGNEVLQVRWFDCAELLRLIANGDMPDSLSLVPILLAMQRGLLS
ncbi:NUDIX domain-containing protein [Chromobacterium sp. IIBBL 290-4]|uniref:NUDIX domain-containing protein n=1 Tax=Chromobacterium sp. IIBBL 290-4 TaxID=2953890 RepID=UPI0020B872F8|nr:NUDIX hydrolase [Chromobacterium sp. IIBBL 290-4]UTH76522.1 NUDIX hydrolase [Chromobacterium sp. IIBBL 290-4]